MLTRNALILSAALCVVIPAQADPGVFLGVG